MDTVDTLLWLVFNHYHLLVWTTGPTAGRLIDPETVGIVMQAYIHDGTKLQVRYKINRVLQDKMRPRELCESRCGPPGVPRP